MSKVTVVAKLVAQEGKREELIQALQSLLDYAQTEQGVEQYSLHKDTKEADVLWMYEQYEDQSALEAHMGTDNFKAAGPKLAPLLGGRPELHFLQPVGGKGL